MFVLLFYCHIWKLIIQCSNISCHLSCDKINNSSNWYQTNGTFFAGWEIYFATFCRAKFGEILHFISNEIIFYQLVYHFIICIHFKLSTRKTCSSIGCLLFFFWQPVFFPDELQDKKSAFWPSNSIIYMPFPSNNVLPGKVSTIPAVLWPNSSSGNYVLPV